ncbi:hypothetical protein CEXT_478341 [Caerostris extrusa]|uniref:Uncharacterized protein n=1 Tax=Caerostris extrusa TaxID=172846 RepID=A0AAV4UJS2_CAEEX|nr:hypothetical protein CEXT_478341 [Caerostris extrusa]
MLGGREGVGVVEIGEHIHVINYFVLLLAQRQGGDQILDTCFIDSVIRLFETSGFRASGRLATFSCTHEARGCFSVHFESARAQMRT